MQLLLALPAYNEEKDLPHVLEAFQRYVLDAGYKGQVVVVNDGSTDETARVIREWSSVIPIDVIEHPRNMGLGETIKDALRRASELAGPDDVIITMDADNTHSPSLIPISSRGRVRTSARIDCAASHAASLSASTAVRRALQPKL